MSNKPRKRRQIVLATQGANGDNTPSRQRGLMPPWNPGESGNPAGRPKGSRNKLAESFVADLQADWREHGADVIERVRIEHPAAFLRVVASVGAKESGANEQANSLDAMTDQELMDIADMIGEFLAAQQIGED